MEKNIKRVKTALLIFMVPVLALSVRMFYIQVMCHDKFAEAASFQHEIAVEGLDTRGQILDRNKKPITGGSYQYYYIIKKKRMTAECENLLDLLGGSQIASSDSDYYVYRTEDYDESINDRLKAGCGAYVFRSRSRYSASQPACHLVGYLNQSEKKGVSGLEYLLEERLKAGKNRLVLLADAAGNILPGSAPSVKTLDSLSDCDNSVVTTIELGLQKKCESLLSEFSSGACIVTDCSDGEILAMASVPVFNPNRISEYLSSDGDCLINKSLQAAYPPGSVFKLVVAAAALENGICTTSQKYECKGEIEAKGIDVSCSTAPDGGHGELDMYEAMALSCNCYFVQLGQAVGSERILEMACRLGLGDEVFEDFPEENEGCVPLASETAEADISNLSIGQGRLLTTPLQIARMTGIIAGSGAASPLRLLAGEGAAPASQAVPAGAGPALALEDRGGRPAGTQVISPETALTLQDLMKSVMVYGTASHLDWTVPVWGKSGTAEASRLGKRVKDCWFTGFCDITTPEGDAKRIGITVFVEDGISGSATALPVFKEIIKYLQNHVTDI